MKNKAVLLSIQPRWCELIANRKKTVEVRRTRPKLGEPFKVYIYCTKSKKEFLQSRNNVLFYCEDEDFIGGHGAGLYIRLNGKVIGEFTCDGITKLRADNILQAYYNNTKETCLSDEEIKRYANGGKLYYWHISNLVIYEEPKELSEFGLRHAPQSWCYV